MPRREGDPQSIRDYVQRVVAEAPPLTPEQRDRLAILLRPDRKGMPMFDEEKDVRRAFVSGDKGRTATPGFHYPNAQHTKVACDVCGVKGYDAAPWQQRHRDPGHAQCEECGAFYVCDPIGTKAHRRHCRGGY